MKKQKVIFNNSLPAFLRRLDEAFNEGWTIVPTTLIIKLNPNDDLFMAILEQIMGCPHCNVS